MLLTDSIKEVTP